MTTLAAFPTLEYRPGVKMNPTPLQTTLSGLAYGLKGGKSAFVTLEPGDATRYDLLLVPMAATTSRIANYSHQDEEIGLVVVRFVGGHAVSCGVILLDRSFHDDLSALARGNPWSAALLGWWFKCLAITMEVK